MREGAEEGWLAECIALARGGDQPAIDRLFAFYRPRIHAYVDRHLSPAARRWVEPEDVVQGILIETLPQLSGLPRNAGPDELLRRLHRTARLRVSDAARNHRRRLGESVVVGAFSRPLEPPAMGTVTGRDYQGWVEELVARLPEKYGEVVRLCGFEGLTCVEAAHRLGLEPDTVRKRYEAARKALDRRLASEGDAGAR